MHLISLLAALLVLHATPIQAQVGSLEDARSASQNLRATLSASAPILIGTTIDLDGPFEASGRDLWKGLRMALFGEFVGPRPVQVTVRSDGYDPARTEAAVEELLDAGIDMMVGSLGTLTAAVSLPMLTSANIPAIAFVSGGAQLRTGHPNVVNLRPGFPSEVAAVFDQAIANGISAQAICAIVRSDSVGETVLEGLIAQLEQHAPDSASLRLTRELLRGFPYADRDTVAPVVSVPFNRAPVARLYKRIVAWEAENGRPCEVVFADGTHHLITRFLEFSRYKKRNWVVAGLSFVGGGPLSDALRMRNLANRLVVARVMPSIADSVAGFPEARQRLGLDLSYAGFEGYLAGRLALHLLRTAKAPLSTATIMEAAMQSPLTFDGIEVDFRGGSDGLKTVRLMRLTPRGWEPTDAQTWREWR